MTFAEELKRRADAGITQEEAAVYLEVSVRSLQQCEQDRSGPNQIGPIRKLIAAYSPPDRVDGLEQLGDIEGMQPPLPNSTSRGEVTEGMRSRFGTDRRACVAKLSGPKRAVRSTSATSQ